MPSVGSSSSTCHNMPLERPTKVLNYVGLLGAFPNIFPIRLLWLEAVGAIFGGGYPVARALIYAVISDVTSLDARYSLQNPCLCAFVIHSADESMVVQMYSYALPPHLMFASLLDRRSGRSCCGRISGYPLMLL